MREHCARCKTTIDLMPQPYSRRIAKDSTRTGSYMCRRCNTERHRKYAATNNGRKNIRRAGVRALRKNLSKQSARMVVASALKAGELLRPNICSSCKQPKKPEAHHSDYSLPKEVTWVCRQCHADIHRKK